MTLTQSTALTREEVEEFLFQEAELIDNWDLNKWADLFTSDGVYLIPPLDDPESKAGETLFIVNDDRHRLSERARRLLKRQAHAEYPRSKIRHIISNIRIPLRETQSDGKEVCVTCNFVVYRSRGENTHVFPGHAIYLLKKDINNKIYIKSKRVIIDTSTLREQRLISIIL